MGANFLPKHVSLISILCSIIFLFFLLTIPSVSAENTTLSAYDVVQQYNFPVGILPQGVVDYEFDYSTGNFKVNLSGPCTFKIKSCKLKYVSTISGVIKKDKISRFEGVKMKWLFLWLNIKRVTRDQDELTFFGGLASCYFDAGVFNNSPTCN